MDKEITGSFQKLLDCLENFVKAETVVGRPLVIGETTVIPVFRVSLGLGAGRGGSENSSSQTGTGVGASIVPHAVISVTNGETTVLPLAGKNSLQAITEMIPDIMNKANCNETKSKN